MIMKCDDTIQSTSCRCNILVRPYVPVHTRDVHKWCTLLCTLLCMPWDCAVHHLACIVQLSRHTGMGASVSFACVVWWNTWQARMQGLQIYSLHCKTAQGVKHWIQKKWPNS